MSLFTFLGGIVVGVAASVVFLVWYGYKTGILKLFFPK